MSARKPLGAPNTRFAGGILLMVALCFGACTPSAQWQFKLESKGGLAVLTMDRATVIFDDVALEAPQIPIPNATGQLTIDGPDFVSGMILVDGSPLETSYTEGVCTVAFHTHKIRIMERGKKIEVDGTVFDISENAKTVVVGEDAVAKELRNSINAQQ